MLTIPITGVLPTDGLASAEVPANARQPLSAPLGSDFIVRLSVVQSDGMPANLVGGSILLTLKKKVTDFQVLVARLGTIEAGGRADFRFVPVDTKNLTPGNFAYDIWFTDTDGNRSALVPTSTFFLEASVGLPDTVGNVPFFPPVANVVTGKLFLIAAPAFADVAVVHAAHAATGANAFPGPVTNPDKPRNLTVTFDAGWDGGDVTVTGFDQFGEVVSETFTASPGATVTGSKVFASVATITKAAVGASAATASVGTGNKLGVLGKLVNATDALLLVDNAAEPATVDAAYNAFTPTVTLPNGLASYVFIANVTE